jgi:hypothetical protein
LPPWARRSARWECGNGHPGRWAAHDEGGPMYIGIGGLIIILLILLLLFRR